MKSNSKVPGLPLSNLLFVLFILTCSINFAQVKPDWIFVEGDTYEMSSVKGSGDDLPVKTVTVGNFYISKYEVTVKEYKAFCKVAGKEMPEAPYWGWNDDEPIVNLVVKEVVDYCKWAGVRLPTEAEWEFAARGGKNSKKTFFSGSNNIKEVGWCTENSKRKVHPVGSKQSNELGIFDMTGNVSELCSDLIEDFIKGTATGKNKPCVYRGGSHFTATQYCCVWSRFLYITDEKENNHGFRIVKDAK